MNTINQHNITYKGGLKSINAVNPISLYTNRYFNRSAKLSGQKFDKIAPQLADKIKSIKLENISAWDVSQGNPKDYIFFLHGMSQNVSNYQHLYETALKHGKGVFVADRHHGQPVRRCRTGSV